MLPLLKREVVVETGSPLSTRMTHRASVIATHRVGVGTRAVDQLFRAHSHFVEESEDPLAVLVRRVRRVGEVLKRLTHRVQRTCKLRLSAAR